MLLPFFPILMNIVLYYLAVSVTVEQHMKMNDLQDGILCPEHSSGSADRRFT